MAFWDDAATLFVDPSGTLLAAKKAAEEAARRAEEEARKRQAAAQAAAAKEDAEARQPGAVGAPSACCGEYQMHDAFLFNSRTGAVWRFDQAKNTLISVAREGSEMQKALLDLLKIRVLEDFQAERAREAAAIHHSRRTDFDAKADVVAKLLARSGS